MGETEITVQPTPMQPSSPADSNKTLEELRKENPVRSNSETSDLTYTAQLAPEIELHSESATKDLEPSHDAPPHEETPKKNSRWKSLIKFILMFFAVTLVYIGIKSLFSEPKMLYPVFDENDSWGFIDDSGKLVVAHKFKHKSGIFPLFNDGLVAIEGQGKIGFLDETGKMVIPPKFDNRRDLGTRRFSEGLCAASNGGKIGYINKRGEYVISPQFDEASPFINGKAAVRLGEKWGFIDKEGEYTITPKFDYVPIGRDPFLIHYLYLNPEGLPAVKKKEDGKYGFINESGEFFISPRFEEACFFTEGLAAVQREDGTWIFIDKDGTPATSDEYDEVSPFSDGLAAVRVGGKGGADGFIDKNGKFIIKPQYEKAYPFLNGIAAVQKDGKWRFINKDGESAWDKEYSHIEGLGFIPPEAKLCMVADEKGLCYINLKGEVVYRFPQKKK